MLGDLRGLLHLPTKVMTDKLVDMFGDKLIPDQEMMNNMAYWFPVLEEIRMRVPKTILVHRGGCDLSAILDGKHPEHYDRFERALFDAMDEIGYPCFFRTGMLSDKFSWKDTCFIEKKPTAGEMLHRVGGLVETSFMANISGRPFNYDFWAVREMIKTKPVVSHFNDMPIAMEIRAFVQGGRILCLHPYWVEESFKNASEEVKEKAKGLMVAPTEKDEPELYEMLKYIAHHFQDRGRSWAVDMLKDVDGDWWCTDMAIGERAYHHESCNHGSGKGGSEVVIIRSDSPITNDSK